MGKLVLKYELGEYYAGKVKVEDFDDSVFNAFVEEEFVADGTSYQYVLSGTTSPNTIEVYINGLKESKTNWVYSSGIITLSFAPLPGDIITIKYINI